MYTELKDITHMCSSSGLRAAFLMEDGAYSYDPVVAICIVDDGGMMTRTLILINDGLLEFAEDVSNYAGICPVNVDFEDFVG